ncbi:MAG: tRNA (adenosine(37)-N6)-dimethylallyltransferase MiaA, partial [Bryobacteraceae bacterium]
MYNGVAPQCPHSPAGRAGTRFPPRVRFEAMLSKFTVMPRTGDRPEPSGPSLLQEDARERPMVALVGPTGSGKSELALQLAEAFQGEVVNCDSLQVYRHFDIGTAKLGIDERRGIPHHLIDILEPDALFTAGEFARAARDAAARISARGRLPIVCGGTGFYLRALLDGLFAGPERDQALRDRLGAREKRRAGSLHRVLRRLDRAASAKIHPNDVPKVMRALEVCLLTRRPVTELFERGRTALTGYRVLKLGLLPDRDALYQRLDARCARMFEAGLVEEAVAKSNKADIAWATKVIGASVTRARQLVDNLLAFSRAVNEESALQPLRLREEIELALVDLSESIFETGARISINSP